MFKAFDYLTPNSQGGTVHQMVSMPFDLEPEKWHWVNRIKEADIVFIQYEHTNTINSLLNKLTPNQLIVVLGLWHIDDWMFDERHLQEELDRYGNDKRIIFVHTNYKNQNKNNVYYDMLFNRQKAYFTDYEKLRSPGEKVWTYGTSKLVYELDNITPKTNSCKTYFAPMKIYNPGIRMKLRKKLHNFLSSYTDGYLSNIKDDVFFDINGVEDSIVQGIKQNSFGGTWFPMHNKYYRDSIVSVYVETITISNRVFSATEKTFDPLIKGHFILPYSNYKNLEYLSSVYGFIFPKWIDYSYDQISDDELRFEKYLDSVKSILETDKNLLIKWANQDLKILDYNRNIFYNRTYDSLYQRIKECVVYRGY